MLTRRKDELKANQIGTPLLIFMKSYNESIPVGFPHSSVKILKTFQSLHPALFKKGDEWSIDKHRKRVMDWLPSHKAASNE